MSFLTFCEKCAKMSKIKRKSFLEIKKNDATGKGVEYLRLSILHTQTTIFALQTIDKYV